MTPINVHNQHSGQFANSAQHHAGQPGLVDAPSLEKANKSRDQAIAESPPQMNECFFNVPTSKKFCPLFKKFALLRSILPRL